MKDSTFAALHDAVTVARDEQIRTVERLKQRLLERGHAAVDVSEAIAAWATYYSRRSL